MSFQRRLESETGENVLSGEIPDQVWDDIEFDWNKSRGAEVSAANDREINQEARKRAQRTTWK